MFRSQFGAARGTARVRCKEDDDAPLTDVGIVAAAADDAVTKTRLLEEDGLSKNLLVVEALKHSWQDLAFHQEQRMVHMRFFLLVAGALIAGFAQAYAAGYVIFALIVSATGCAVGVLFIALDYHDSQFANKSVDSILPLEKIVAGWLGTPEFMITKRGLLKPALLRWLRIVISPIRILMFLGLLMSFFALFASLRMTQERLCTKGAVHVVSFEKALCEHPVPPAFNVMVSKLMPPGLHN